MNLNGDVKFIRLENKYEWKDFLISLLDSDKFYSIGDWSYYFNLQIFAKKDNESQDEYEKRIDHNLTDKEIIAAYNDDFEGPEESEYPVIVCYKFSNPGDIELYFIGWKPARDIQTIKTIDEQRNKKKFLQEQMSKLSEDLRGSLLDEIFKEVEKYPLPLYGQPSVINKPIKVNIFE